MILTTAIAIAAAAAPIAAAPNPTFLVDSYRLTVQTPGATVRHIVLGPERFRSDPVSSAVPNVVVRDGRMWVGPTKSTRGLRVTNRYSAEPDGATGIDDVGLRLARFAVAEARAGKLTLEPAVLDDRQVLKAEMDLAANGCTRAPAGTATIWLTKSTLLPRRLRVERDGKARVYRYRYTGFNKRFGLGAVNGLPLGSNPRRVNEGFRRRAPLVAAGPLPFVPRLPTVLPSGFALSTSGWAPRGARTGAGDRNRREPFVFAAVYVRGWERIAVTQRVAANGTWTRDPFGDACLRMQSGRTTVGTRPARYGIGTEITSHLWWRDGGILYTVSGPYGKRDLQTIALSLAKVA